VSGLKEISYYPSQTPWGAMWFNWQPTAIDADLAKIAALGANTVRIFIQPATFGYPTPMTTYVSRLGQVLSMAAAHGLKVHLTLFDLFTSYTDITGSEQWASALLSPLHGDSRIAAVELQNEINPTNAQAISWAQTMLPAIRSYSGLPVTVSVTGWDTATPLAQLISALGSVKPDFYDLHVYGNPAFMQSAYLNAKQMAGSTPLIIGETGYSTDPSNTYWIGANQTVAMQEQAQAYYISYAEQTAKSVGLPPVGLWTLNDFPSGLPNVTAVEQHFGLYRLDGTAKPAVATVQSFFGK
jgi:endo-1,4-beta-mannosidase